MIFPINNIIASCSYPIYCHCKIVYIGLWSLKFLMVVYIHIYKYAHAHPYMKVKALYKREKKEEKKVFWCLDTFLFWITNCFCCLYYLLTIWCDTMPMDLCFVAFCLISFVILSYSCFFINIIAFLLSYKYNRNHSRFFACRQNLLYRNNFVSLSFYLLVFRFIVYYWKLFFVCYWRVKFS